MKGFQVMKSGPPIFQPYPNNYIQIQCLVPSATMLTGFWHYNGAARLRPWFDPPAFRRNQSRDRWIKKHKKQKDWLSLAAEPPFRKNFRLADAQGDWANDWPMKTQRPMGRHKNLKETSIISSHQIWPLQITRNSLFLGDFPSGHVRLPEKNNISRYINVQ